MSHRREDVAVASVLLVVLGLAVFLPAKAFGTYPGANGKLAFNTGIERPGQYHRQPEVFTANFDGTGLQQLTLDENDGRGNLHPRWSPDGTKIAYWGWKNGNSEIFTMNADGTGKLQLTDGSDTGLLSSSPSWSPDGRSLVYETVSAREGSELTGVYTVRADGTDERRIVPRGFAVSFGYREDVPKFRWSPDGGAILTVMSESAGPTNDPDVVTIDPRTGEITNLTENSEQDFYPSWSPDGRQIVFTRIAARGPTYEPDNWEIYRMDRDGGNVDRLTNDPAEDNEPDWSPDGSRIVFVSDRGSFSPHYEDRFNVLTIDPDGTRLGDMTRSPRGYHRPVWSPDSRKTAFIDVRNSSTPASLYTREPDGSNWTYVATVESSNNVPDWQPLNRRPDCAGVSSDRTTLTPPNHRLVPVQLEGASDPDGDSIALSVDDVTQDERVRGPGSGHSPDAQLTSQTNVIELRAERDSRGDGRVYTISFSASDRRGGTCAGSVSVSVPRRKGREAIDSAPPSYHSLSR